MAGWHNILRSRHHGLTSQHLYVKSISQWNINSWSLFCDLIEYMYLSWLVGYWCPLVRSYTHYVCLFALGFIVPIENFSLIWRCHHYRWRAANFDIRSTCMAIEQWGFFSVPHLLWHGASVYDGHIRGPVTLKPIAERLAVRLSLTVFTTVCCVWDSNTQPFACGDNALTHCAIAAVFIWLVV